MRPRNIRYTQDSIGSRFTDGRYLSDTFDQLLNRRISVDELEWIEVVEVRSLYWALTGNRRLYLYRKLEDLGEIHKIPVHEMSLSDYGVRRRFENRDTTTCDGLDIEMRQPQAERFINRAIEQWKASRMPTRNLNEISRIHGQRHLPTAEASHRATSTDRNDTNRVAAQNSRPISKARVITNTNDNEIVVTTQPYTSTGFNSNVAELLRRGSTRSAQTGPNPPPTSSAKPGLIRGLVGSEHSHQPDSIHSIQSSCTRSVQQGSTRSIPRGSMLPSEPGSNRPVESRHRPKVNDIFYDGCGPSPVAQPSGRTRSSSSVRPSHGRPSLPTNLDGNNSARTGGRTGVGVVGIGTEQGSGDDVVTYQPQGSTDPLIVPDQTCCSCCSCCF